MLWTNAQLLNLRRLHEIPHTPGPDFTTTSPTTLRQKQQLATAVPKMVALGNGSSRAFPPLVLALPRWHVGTLAASWWRSNGLRYAGYKKQVLFPWLEIQLLPVVSKFQTTTTALAFFGVMNSFSPPPRILYTHSSSSAAKFAAGVLYTHFNKNKCLRGAVDALPSVPAGHSVLGHAD